MVQEPFRWCRFLQELSNFSPILSLNKLCRLFLSICSTNYRFHLLMFRIVYYMHKMGRIEKKEKERGIEEFEYVIGCIRFVQKGK